MGTNKVVREYVTEDSERCEVFVVFNSILGTKMS